MLRLQTISLPVTLSPSPPLPLHDYSLQGKYKHLYTIKCAVYFDVWFSASVSDAPRPTRSLARSLALSGLAWAWPAFVLSEIAYTPRLIDHGAWQQR